MPDRTPILTLAGKAQATAGDGRIGRINRFGPPVRVEHHGYVWIIFGPAGISCWGTGTGATLLPSREDAAEVLASLGYRLRDDNTVERDFA